MQTSSKRKQRRNCIICLLGCSLSGPFFKIFLPIWSFQHGWMTISSETSSTSAGVHSLVFFNDDGLHAIFMVQEISIVIAFIFPCYFFINSPLMHMITRVEFNALTAAYFTIMSRGMKFLLKKLLLSHIFSLCYYRREKVVIIFALNHHY